MDKIFVVGIKKKNVVCCKKIMWSFIIFREWRRLKGNNLLVFILIKYILNGIYKCVWYIVFIFDWKKKYDDFWLIVFFKFFIICIDGRGLCMSNILLYL